jgi:uncharacterized membrane protein
VKKSVHALVDAAHPALVVFILVLLATAATFDGLYLVGGHHGIALAAAYTIPVAAGAIGGILLAVLGRLLDRVAVVYATAMVGSVSLANMTLVLAVAGLLQIDAGTLERGALLAMLIIATLLLCGVTGWLGDAMAEHLRGDQHDLSSPVGGGRPPTQPAATSAMATAAGRRGHHRGRRGGRRAVKRSPVARNRVT